MNTPIRWHGGKHYLAKRIIALMPPHIHFVEPFAGGLSVLLAKNPEGVSEVVNDLQGRLVNFWRVLRDARLFSEFVHQVNLTPFSHEEWVDSCWVRTNPVEDAVHFFVNIRQSLGARGDAFQPLSKRRTRRGMNEQVSAWLSAIDGLPEVHERLRRVVIENLSAIDLIRREDTENTLFYCDPPYLQDTRTSPEVYDHEMTAGDHKDLLQTLAGIQGKFLLSGYRSLIYDEFADECGWHRVDFDLANHSASGRTKRRMIECVWMNYMPEQQYEREQMAFEADGMASSKAVG
jgi:DNA adenine methylase